MKSLNYEEILQQIQVAEKKSALKQKVRLLAVSKLQPIEKILELMKKGQVDFGENYVQEALKKIESFQNQKDQVKWHLIGHLQKNKVKSVVGFFDLIHSVDSLELAMKISLEMGKKHPGKKQKILIQINQGSEDSKTGFDENLLLQQWSELSKLENIEIHGLMSLPPIDEDPEKSRPYFQKLRQTLEKLQRSASGHPLQQLSMGTSQDFLIAVEEGATIIRVGTLLFGARS